MANCEPNVTIGKIVPVEFSIGCMDELPKADDWKVLGGLKGKDLSSSWDTEDTTADDTVGNVRESVATYRTLEFSGDGIVRNTGDFAENVTDLLLHFNDPVATGGQPVAWFRITYPNVTYTIPALIGSFDLSSPNDSAYTFSLSISATASLVGVKVERTPKPTGETRTVTPPKGDK